MACQSSPLTDEGPIGHRFAQLAALYGVPVASVKFELEIILLYLEYQPKRAVFAWRKIMPMVTGIPLIKTTYNEDSIRSRSILRDLVDDEFYLGLGRNNHLGQKTNSKTIAKKKCRRKFHSRQNTKGGWGIATSEWSYRGKFESKVPFYMESQEIGTQVRGEYAGVHRGILKMGFNYKLKFARA